MAGCLWLGGGMVRAQAPSAAERAREGGLDALGTGFPGIKREDLMVLPDKEWLAMKDLLTYEAWAAKMMAAEARAAR